MSELEDLGLISHFGDDATPREPPPLKDLGIDRDILLRGYHEMRRLRAIDARMIVLQRQGRVGFYGACTGQEAVPIATGLAVQEGDWVFPALREQSVMLVRGFPLVAFIAQVFGNSGDVLKGRQMPSHHSGRSVNQVSWSSNIGPQVPQAVGCAMAMKLKGDKSVAIGFMGDGATSEADFHVAMRFAARYKAPAVLVCQNNHWSISVPTRKQTISQTIAVKARAYGIEGIRVDGNDLFSMVQIMRRALEKARNGGGPTFIEALTYRIGAHSTSDDPTRYRADEEVERWKKKDPLDRLRNYLVREGLVTEASDQKLDEAITKEISAAVNEVEAMPPPTRESLFEDVYRDLTPQLKLQQEELLRHPPAISPHG